MSLGLAAAAVLCAFAAGCTARPVLVEAHRGAGTSVPGSAVPENTLPAFRAGEEALADVLELDVHLLADGTLAVIHDDTLDRTTDARGCVAARTREELGGVDAAARTPLAGGNVRVPSLEEVLLATPLPVDVELKRESGAGCARPSADDLARALIAAVDRAAARRRVLVSSFDRETLSSLHALAPELPLALLSASRVTPEDAVTVGARAISLEESAIDRAVVEAAHARSLSVHAWTVDSPERARGLAALGVDRIITDHPAALRGALGSRSRAPGGLLRGAAACAAVVIVAILSRRRRATPRSR